MFAKFPTPEEFADQVLIAPDQAKVLLDWIAEAVGTKYVVSVDAVRMAAFAINNGMEWEKVAAIFGSWYKDFEQRKNAARLDENATLDGGFVLG